jgi:hypothetical protein
MSDTAEAPLATRYDMNEISKAYVALREARRQLKKQYEDEDAKFKGGLQKLEAIMLAHLNAANADSVRTENGTFYKQEAVTPSASDWQLVYDWIKDNDAWDLLERRVKSTFIKEYQEAHDGALPPGISVYREYVIRVRKAT